MLVTTRANLILLRALIAFTVVAVSRLRLALGHEQVAPGAQNLLHSAHGGVRVAPVLMAEESSETGRRVILRVGSLTAKRLEEDLTTEFSDEDTRLVQRLSSNSGKSPIV